MKSKIFMYLFLFAALIALYLFVSNRNIITDQMSKNENLSGRVEILQDSIQQLNDSVLQLNLKFLDSQYFSLENNEDALVYYDHLNLRDPSNYIIDKLLETNEKKGDNPLVPYEGMHGDFKINKIKILNHKWIVADFSDGKFWGELMLQYELKDDTSVDFKLKDHLLYTRSN